MKSTRALDLFTVNAYWPGIAFLWNSLHLIVLPAMLLGFVDDARKNTALGLLTFVGLIIAAICMPVGGLFAIVLGFLISRADFPAARAAATTLSSASSSRSCCMCPMSVTFWTETVLSPKNPRARTSRSVRSHVRRFPMWTYR